jgi:hypothetical protein
MDVNLTEGQVEVNFQSSTYFLYVPQGRPMLTMGFVGIYVAGSGLCCYVWTDLAAKPS